MTPSTDLNFIAKSDLAQLDDLIIDLQQQRAILQSLFKALQVLSKGVSRHKKFKRIRATLTLIYHEPRDPKTDRWREALEKLDDVSRSLCIFALTDKQIFETGDAPFHALIEGIRQFAEADPDRRNVIVSAIGAYVRETISNLTNQPNRRDANPLKRPGTAAGEEGRRQKRASPRERLTMPAQNHHIATGELELEGCRAEPECQSLVFAPGHSEAAGQAALCRGSFAQPTTHVEDFRQECHIEEDGQPGWFVRSLTSGVPPSSCAQSINLDHHRWGVVPAMSDTGWLGRGLDFSLASDSGEMDPAPQDGWFAGLQPALYDMNEAVLPNSAPTPPQNIVPDWHY